MSDAKPGRVLVQVLKLAPLMKTEYAFSRLVLKPCLALLVGFAALIGLVHLQPQDFSSLLALVTPPEGCAPPCWQGIRPGETTADEAVAILEVHPWVTDISISGYLSDGRQQGSISWRWNGAQPFPVETGDGGYLGINQRVVQSITLETGVRFGDLWLLLDQPEQGAFSYVGTVGVPRGYMVKYRNNHVTILAEVNCRRFWERENVILFSATHPETGGYNLMRAREASCNPREISFSS
jgi:hypothetical protein